MFFTLHAYYISCYFTMSNTYIVWFFMPQKH